MQFTTRCLCIPKRYFVIFLMFIGNIVSQLLRANLSIAIIDMTSNKTVIVDNEIRVTSPEFNWNSVEKGIALGAFAWGFIISGFTALIVGRIGGVTMYGIGLTVAGVLSLLSPFVLQINFYLFLALRVLEGFSECLSAVFSFDIFVHWVPPTERTRLIAVSYLGIMLGAVVSFPLCGHVTYTLGWRAVFYMTGIVTLTWSSIWFILVRDTPAADKFISQAERSFLSSVTGNVSNERVTIPWKCILSSKPAWAFVNESFCSACISSFLLISFPSYVKDMLDLNTKEVGLISAIPLLCGIIIQPFFARLADYLRSTNIYSISTVHKIFISGGQIFILIFLVAAAFCANFWTSVVCFSLIRVSCVLALTSYIVLPIDLAGQYAAVLQAIITSCQSVAFFLSLTIQGYMVPNKTQAEWNQYFLFLSVISMYGVFMFFRYGSGETQAWANLQNQKKELSEYVAVSTL